MKTLKDFINENMICEAVCKDLHNPRKGATVYVLKEGDSKAIQVKITNVTKTKKSQLGSYDIYVEFEDNSYNLPGYTEYHFGTVEYNDPKQVYSGNWVELGTFFIGVSKEVIQEFINTKGNDQLQGVLKQIADLEKQLKALYKKKDKYEAEANMQISESLVNESKKLKQEDLDRTVEVHLDGIYNDGYDSPQKAMKALKELAEKGECEMLDYLTSSIDAHDGEITEDDLLDNWDAYVKTAQKYAKEWLK